ncbi:Protein app1 [Choanephora cucurbitarum]|uniref:Protein app1 n=1 Tax=Choanephora cucurbitarum TaxID=101091 RepID=A0A1C7N3K2_9FUNG|nr:Protein app1 [Choanephora cucurbitarum]
MCDITDPRILNAYISITEHDPTDWLILGYKGTRDVISLYSCGENGLSEFRDNLTDEILFGFIRIEDKFVLVTYVPDTVRLDGYKTKKKRNGNNLPSFFLVVQSNFLFSMIARALVHSRAVANILELSHAQLTASSLSDLSDGNIRTRLKLGQNQVPNRSRPVSKRTSAMATRRRKSGTYSPSPSPSPMSERNLRIHINSMDDYYDDASDRMTATPTPSTPTSVTSSSYANEHYFAIAESPFSLTEEQERKRIQEQTEDMLQTQLARKKELEEARFRQFQREQQEERIRREQTVRRMEEEKRVQQQKEIPPWQLQLKQRKEQQKESRQQKIQSQPQPQQQQIPLWQQQLQQRKLQKQQQLEKEKAQIEERLREQRQARVEKQKELSQSTDKQKTKSMPESTKEPIVTPKSTEEPIITPKIIEEPIVAPKSIEEPIITPMTMQEPTLMVTQDPATVTQISAPIKEEVVVNVEEPEVIQRSSPASLNIEEAPSVQVISQQEEISSSNEIKKEVVAEEVPVMTGFISVQTSTSPFWRRRHFVLYTSQLLLFKDELSKEAMHTIPICSMKRVAPADEDEDTYVANSYMIDTQPGLSFQILADDKKTGKQIYTTLQQLL